MSFNVAAIDGKLFWNRTCRRHLLKDALPDTAAGPSVVAVVDRRWRAIGRRDIAPAAAGLEDVQDTADDAPVIYPWFAGLAMRQMRLDCLPCIVREPK